MYATQRSVVFLEYESITKGLKMCDSEKMFL